jgi:hypothetical protein
VDPGEAFNEDVHRARQEYISARWKQLSEITKEQSLDGLKYLFHINAGASAAVLAFIGTTGIVRTATWPWVMLLFFVCGIISIGLLHFLRFHYLAWLFKKFREDVQEYYASPKPWEEIIDGDRYRNGKHDWILGFAYVALGCFITGVIIGALNFKQLSQAEEKYVESETTILANSPITKPESGAGLSEKPRTEHPTTGTDNPKK